MDQKAADLRIVALKEWSSVARPGVGDFLAWLDDSDYFISPASTQFHGSYEGGLNAHSLNVLRLLRDKLGYFELDYGPETPIIAALGHDLCKVGAYKLSDKDPSDKQVKFLKDLMQKAGEPFAFKEKLTAGYASKLIDWYNNRRKGEKPEPGPTYEMAEDLEPLGHGPKSVMILQRFIKLTLSEQLAITWHMTAFDAGIHFNYPNGYAYRKAVEIEPLVTLLFTADFEASNILEAKRK